MYTVDKEGNAHSVQKVENYVEIEEVRADAPSDAKVDIEKIKKLLKVKMQPQKESFLKRYGLYLLLLFVILIGAGCWYFFSKQNKETKVEEPKFGLYF